MDNDEAVAYFIGAIFFACGFGYIYGAAIGSMAFGGLLILLAVISQIWKMHAPPDNEEDEDE